MRKRRYEILLPLTHNDGRPVSDQILHQTRAELLSKFDGVSFQPQSIVGLWIHERVPYEDTSVRLTVDVKDTKKNREFFLKYKRVLLKRFEQMEIYIVSYPVEIL